MAALADSRVDTPVIFEPVLADVETLNQWALEERLDVTKLSFTALGRVRNSYGLLYAGAALGRGCGPLVVSTPGKSLSDLEHGTVAAPGELTTACLLLSLYLGRQPDFRQMVFSDIMPCVASGEADFGLIIHEGRFTYANYGLQALLDLGEWWERETGAPIPLGGIAVRRDLGSEMGREIDRAIHQSLMLARANPEEAMPYVLEHAQEMDRDVIMQHVELYVNSFSMDLGMEGEQAVQTLFARAESARLISHSPLPLMAY